MSARLFTVISILANLALGALLVREFRHVPVAPVATASVGTQQRIAPAPVSGPSATPAAPPAPVVEAFDWSGFASADFKLYRDRLLERGCPTNVARMILTCEIREHYGAEMRAALTGLQARFWDLLVESPENLQEASEEATEKIVEERKRVIREVVDGLGNEDQEQEKKQQERDIARLRASYRWLPEEKQEAMVALDRKFQADTAAFWAEVKSRTDRNLTTDDRARQKAMEEELKAGRKQLLTQEEFAEYELRNSSGAHWAANAGSFEPSRDEWSAVAKLAKQNQEALNELNKGKPKTAEERNARAAEVKRLGEEFERARDAVLGPERAAEFARENNQDYRQARAVAQRYDLPDSVATQVYNYQREALRQADALRADKSFDPAARTAALAQIRQETERTIEQAMGARAFGTYRQYDSGFFDRLGRK